MGRFANSLKAQPVSAGRFSQSMVAGATPKVITDKERIEEINAARATVEQTAASLRQAAKDIKNQQTAAKHSGYQYAAPAATSEPVNPVAKFVSGIGTRFAANPQNAPTMKALASAPAQAAFNVAKSGTAALAGGVANVGAGLGQFGDQLMTFARTPNLPKFAQTPESQAAVAAESAAGQQRRAQLRSDVEGVTSKTQKNLGVTDKQAQGLGYQVVSSIPQMATLFVPGGQTTFFTSVAGNYASDAEKRGASPDKAFAYGLAGAAAELASEKLLFLVPKSVRSAATKLLGKAAPLALRATRPVGEAAQEAVIGPVMGLAEKALFNPDKEWVGAGGVVDFNQMKGDALAGALLGTVFMGLASPNADTQQKAQKIVEQAQATGEPDIQAANDLAAELKAQQEATAAATEQGGINLQQFGTVDPGPTVGTGPTVESKLSENVAAGRVGNATVSEAFRNDPITHQQLTKTQTMEDMNTKMADYDGSTKSLDKIYNSWADRIQSGEGVTTGDIPLVRVLANEYEKAGQSNKAEQAYAIVAEAALTYGRYVNAFKYIYDEVQPARVIAGAQKITDKINEEGDKRYGKKWVDLELTKEETDAFAGLKTLKEKLTAEANAMPDGVSKQEALDAIPDKIAEEQARIMEGVTDRWAEIVPSTAIEKWNYWRRFAMLTSPKTHVRNIVSNAGRVVMEGVKDSVATGLERITFVPKEQRLHSAGWMFNKPVFQKANELWKTVKSELTHTMKYEVTSIGGLERKVKPLGKTVGAASEFVMNALEKEDEGFMRLAFVSSLAQQMQARGVSEPTPAMIERAKNVSLENTYKLMNSFSEAIMSVKKAGGLPGGALDALLPFTRTPAAVAKTAVEFTPGLGLVQMGRDIKRGRITNRAEAIDALSKQIVGSGLLALGYFMAKVGLGFGEDEKSAKAKEIQQLGGGRQPFSIKVGDSTFTIDWMQPTSSPIITGMQLYQTIKNKGLQAVPSSLSSVMTSAIDTFFDQSMLSGVGQLFKADDKGEAILNLGVDYIMQGIPVLYTQIARAASGPERSSYDPSMSFEEKVANRFVSKLAPWTLPKKSDVLGGDKTQGAGIDIANAVLSPGFIKKQSDDPAAAELYRLYSVRKDEDGTEMLPKVAPNAVTNDNATRKTSDDVKVKLTPEQRIQFTREYGLAVQQEVTKKLADSRYVKKTDEEKVKAIKDLMNKLYETQKAKMAK